jgi:hypothetical protein
MYTLSKKVHLAVNLQVKSFDPGLRAGSTAAGAADYALVLDFIRQDSDVLSINCSSIGILRLLPPTLIRHLSRRSPPPGHWHPARGPRAPGPLTGRSLE